MSKMDAYSFIKQYSRFYLDSPQDPISDEDFNNAGIPKTLNRTNPGVEEYITEKIKKGIFDAQSFAWKAGKAAWKDGHFDYVKPLPDIWNNGNGSPIKLTKDSEAFTGEEFDKYVSGNPIDVKGYNFALEDDRRKLFLKIKDTYSLFNYGTVYIINQMFFLSKGAIPIYDRFAHVAVKALRMGKSPLEVFVPDAPLKNDHPKGKDRVNKEYFLAVNNLEEYMWLLNEVFPDEIHKNGDIMFISRELDQALWVYGHAIRKWPFEESK
ncbi:hypothetical protein SAMN02910358_01873 [Lachnospiraceae bacterium XBB1006]|nr:hypothetical protein SAMN02910358_01873 [Lachnospiraceae bacterium XBB1006]